MFSSRLARIDHLLVARVVIGDRDWITPSLLLMAAGTLLIVLLNRQRLFRTVPTVALRGIGWVLICVCLMNPLWSSSRPRQGANVFAVVVDDSRSQNVLVDTQTRRAERLQQLLETGERVESDGWLQRLDDQFELRRYRLNDFLQQTSLYINDSFDGASSRLSSGLHQLMERYRGQPLAGVLLLSDGNATDASIPMADLPVNVPVNPVVLAEDVPVDLRVQSVSSSLSAFDDAPVTLQIQMQSNATEGHTIRTSVFDEEGVPQHSETRAAGETSPLRISVRPKKGGTVFYRVRTELRDATGQPVQEATTINNERLIAVDRGSEPRRILYIAGRPNWDFKFLRRAVESDSQTELVGLIRIARKEAKFEFRARGQRSNSLFRGFDEAEQEVAEEYDEPVLIRLGTKDDQELSGGVPQDPTELFAYDALILDDVETEFFTADQLQLFRDFVTRRGGGFLMLGGQESFRRGEYDRTPVGELLPVDLQREALPAAGPVRLDLTREGWLQPWVRLRNDEDSENRRLQEMPAFETLNPAVRVRPGAQVMASVSDQRGNQWPALVVQRFGRGRSAALCIGDLWRWRMHEGRLRSVSGTSVRLKRDSPGVTEDRGDYARAARQMIRWLVSETPRRLEVTSAVAPEEGVHCYRLSAVVRDRKFTEREDAEVRFVVTRPDGTTMEQVARPSDDEVGRYNAIVTAAESGAWKCKAVASLPSVDDTESETLSAEHGWASQPDQLEMAAVTTNRSWLKSLADHTGGRIISADELDEFVDSLPASTAPVMELRSWPVWHQWTVFLLAVACFAGEWTLRRRQGYP